MKRTSENFRIQVWVISVALVLFIVKLAAFAITHSVAVLTDALEGTVNLAAGFIGLYSLYVSGIPSDQNHPYGHGKAEFISAAIEGTLICVAGVLIIYQAIQSLIEPRPVHQLDFGMLLLAFTALVNFALGAVSIHKGKKNSSMALVASGNHLRTDAFTTIGIIIGIALIYFTGLLWIDGVVAILFSLYIIFTGYKIVRTSIAGIMDEADMSLLQEVIDFLDTHRRENWIDLHKFRVIKYGGQLHVDCHLTVPWYLNVNEAHTEIEELGKLISKHFSSSIEIFVHSDACLYTQCNICIKSDCPVRKHPFENRVKWNLKNILADKKHQLHGSA